MCWFDSSWGGDTRSVRWHRVALCLAPKTDEQKAIRLALMRDAIMRKLDDLTPDLPAIVGIESLPTHGAFALGALGELHGVVKVELVRRGWPFVIANQSTGRSLLLGKIPRLGKGELKPHVLSVVRSFPGLESIDGDSADAVVTANYAAFSMKAENVRFIAGSA